jgi:tRNA A37 threonylcarbamoyladenosine biosynthesis protein TsaE
VLEGTIKLHGEPGAGKTQLLHEVERALNANPHLANAPFRLVCKTQQPGQPEQHEVTFTRKGKGQELRANWGRG